MCETDDIRQAPIAVVGMACRTAGAEDADALWKLIVEERRAIGPVPDGRLPGVDPGPVSTGPLQAALLEEADGFDAEFFEISRRMAAWMDPHQRMLLELTWHALEDAGMAPHTLRGQDVAVFTAAAMSDYRERMVAAGRVDSAALPGTLMTFVANRVSYQFDWTGPSYAMDSACATGLSVLAPAISGLRTGEFPLAAVMAANLTSNGFYTSSALRARALSPTGDSVPFSSRHDGYIRGEGGVCLLLKRLDDALASGDPIHAVIRGVGLAHSGRAGGLTGSEAEPQTRLITRTAETCGVPLSSIGYLEAHGTGTGADSAEITGLANALAAQAEAPAAAAGPDSKLWIGTIKANIGHLEMAAGLVGVVKTILVLRHDTIPGIAGLDRPDPAIDWGDLPLALPERAVAWPAGNAVRRVAVNSFGIGGSLACAIIEDPPVPLVTLASPPQDRPMPVPVPLSAAGPKALKQLAARMERRLAVEGDTVLAPIAWTLQNGRDGLSERRVITATGLRQLCDGLHAIAHDQPHTAVATPTDFTGLKTLETQGARLAADWLNGTPVDWSLLWERRPAKYSRLPGYPFQRRHHWFDARASPVS
ncbi:polyketide synthase [Streptomyces sp. ISID311]|uniref:beta-ketoacyl [acyl carrier protein] synthase domain-containing protein n=1 Tax=Streptomyces sp. ISID311 TaxID=2601673 RepID=UPI00164BD9DB|nr:polyketide synthase [Streptomyces sp. ISID311]